MVFGVRLRVGFQIVDCGSGVEPEVGCDQGSDRHGLVDRRVHLGDSDAGLDGHVGVKLP